MTTLAGDVGGTKTVLALFGDTFDTIAQKSYPSRDHPDLTEIVRAFMTETGARVTRAAFGVAGPVRHGRSKTTNLPWVVDSKDLARELGLARTGLINDLEANAYGIAALGADDFLVLSEGAPDARGNQAVIAAGTGLGEAGLYWDGRTHRPFSSEGGHSGLAPRDETEIALLRYLLERFDHVSCERAISGPGLHLIYLFLRDTGRGAESDGIAARMRAEDPAAVISRAALDHEDPLCERTLDLFVRLYGAEAGNLALKLMATGGVFLGGGIAPKIVGKLRDGAFMASFTAKGPMTALVESMPVRVVLNDRAALLGAARYASIVES